MLFASAAFAQQISPAPPNQTPPFTETQLEITRLPLRAMTAFVYGDKSRQAHGGAIRMVRRMIGKGLYFKDASNDEISNNEETLVLESENKTSCYIPQSVVIDMGFNSVEEFRVYLTETDIAAVECRVDFDQKLNLARSVTLTYAFVRRNKAPEVKLEVKPEAFSQPQSKKSKPSRGERASP
jgi:hypothetical protein